jgi:hypothetical protein
MLFNQVSQRQPTTHDMADRERSKRVSIALLIRKSSVRARRGPPRICAGQKLRSAFAPHRTVPEKGLMAHRVFESVGRRFQPGGAKRCLRRSAVCPSGLAPGASADIVMRPEDLLAAWGA